MGTLIFGLILLVIGLSIVAVVIEGVERKFQYQIDNLKKENKKLKQRLFDLE